MQCIIIEPNAIKNVYGRFDEFRNKQKLTYVQFPHACGIRNVKWKSEKQFFFWKLPILSFWSLFSYKNRDCKYFSRVLYQLEAFFVCSCAWQRNFLRINSNKKKKIAYLPWNEYWRFASQLFLRWFSTGRKTERIKSSAVAFRAEKKLTLNSITIRAYSMEMVIIDNVAFIRKISWLCKRTHYRVLQRLIEKVRKKEQKNTI